MKLIRPSIEFLDMNSKGLSLIEQAGRTCYKSEAKIGEGTDKIFTEKLLNRGHEAMIEFGWLCYKIICDRGVTHEIVRHRLFSFAQESTRYVNYKEGVNFILPPWIQDKIEEGEYPWDRSLSQDMSYKGSHGSWFAVMMWAENMYQKLLGDGWTPQQARSVLPNSLKTEIVVGGNFREWRHFFSLRCSKKAHPQMQEVANMILRDVITRVPVVFDEYLEEESNDHRD